MIKRFGLCVALCVGFIAITACRPIEPAASAATTASLEEYVSVAGFFSTKVPAGWRAEEVIPGANVVLADSVAALDRYRTGSAVESGDFVVNVGFLPLALLQEKELSHLGFQFGASPEIFLKSLLPLFRVADGAVLGEAELVSVDEERPAGMLTVSADGREGMILVFEAGDGVIALVSTVGHPGEAGDFQEVVYSIAASVSFSGSQDALYSALYGG